MIKSETMGISNKIYEDSWDLLGQLIDARDAEKIICSLENDESLLQEADEYYKQFDSVNLRRLKKFYSIAKLKRVLTKTIPQLLKTIATIIGFAWIGISVAVASSATIRQYLTKLIIEATPDHTSLWIEKVEMPKGEVPDEWHGKYFPTTIPEDVVVSQVFNDGEDGYVTYRHPNNPETVFSFHEITEGVINLDTEGAIIEDLRINGIPGHAVLKAGSVILYWQYEDTLLIIDAKNSSLEEATRYAESVIPVQRND